MKKLYRKGAVVHPTPPSPIVSDNLSFLPAAILTLTAALSPDDREVLAYLVSCSSDNPSSTRKSARRSAAGGGGLGEHPSSFNCYCFGCYTSYWARWDSSPNRQLIDEIIDAYEEGLVAQSKKGNKGKKERRRRGSRSSCDGAGPGELKGSESRSDELDDSEAMEESNSWVSGEGEEEEEEFEKGSMRRLLSFLEERIWGVWT